MLTQRHRIAIRRHLGVPFAGTAQAGRLFGWRFEIHVEDLEYKMSNMQPSEEQLITGYAMGSYRIDGNPTVGDVLTFTITDEVNGTMTATYTVTSADLNPRPNFVNPSEASPSFSIALNAANAINDVVASKGYSAVGVMPADLFSPQYLPPYFAEVIITGPGPSVYTIGCSRSGTTNLLVQDQAAPSPIAATVNGVQVYGYTALLDALAMGMTSANLSLAYQKADVVNFRPDEVGARLRLYREYCIMLSRDMGGKDYVRRFGGTSGGGSVA